MIELLVLALLLQDPPELRLKDFEYDASHAEAVKAVAEALKRGEKEPAAALKVLEEKVLAKPPDPSEVRIVVVFSKGVSKGTPREEIDFRPFRSAARLALAAGLPERAIELLARSPTSGDLLAEARAALEEKKRREALPVPSAGPAFDPAPFVERGDFEAGRKALDAVFPSGGPDRERHLADLKREALSFQRSRLATAAARLFRIAEPDGPRELARPLLDACARVPDEWRIPELAWMRDLEAWGAKPDPDGLDRLATAAAGLDPALGAVLRIAQERRVAELESLVAEADRASRDARPALLERLAGVERAWAALARLHEEPELRKRLEAAKARLPIDPEILGKARAGAVRIDELRALADALDRLWTSKERERLSEPDEKELALRLGIARSEVLLLDGKRPEEVARDPRVAEVFRIAPPLPADASPRIAAVRKLAK